MKVLNVCAHDWANFSHDNANALRSVGVNCEDIKEFPHAFKYESESKIMTVKEIAHKIKEADVIQIMHSDLQALELCNLLDKKRVIVYHTGTYYRLKFAKLNNLFNPYVERSVIALGEFAGKGAKNETYMVGAINTVKLVPKYSNAQYIRFAHFPSCEITKGTETINEVVKNIHNNYPNFYFNLSTIKVSYNEQLERMKQCDVYIELFAPTQHDRPYGSWGITALEAAALGKIVVTNHTTENVYKSAYGIKTPFFVSNTEKELYNSINELARMTREEIRDYQKQTREWVVKYHSYAATGNYIKSLL